MQLFFDAHGVMVNALAPLLSLVFCLCHGFLTL